MEGGCLLGRTRVSAALRGTLRLGAWGTVGSRGPGAGGRGSTGSPTVRSAKGPTTADTMCMAASEGDPTWGSSGVNDRRPGTATATAEGPRADSDTPLHNTGRGYRTGKAAFART